MKKQKVFIPVEDMFQEYDGTYLPKSGNPLNVREQEDYVFTPESLKELVAECIGFVWGKYGTEKDREEECKKLSESLNIK